jgi:hypothetical protein
MRKHLKGCGRNYPRTSDPILGDDKEGRSEDESDKDGQRRGDK